MPIAPFDASRDFTVSALSLLASGKSYVRGDPFEKGSVSGRVLQRLWEVKQIRYSDDPHRGMVPSDPLLTPKAERKAAKAAKGALRKPTVDEDALAEKLVTENTKPALLAMAAGLEGVKPEMNKKAIALAIIRAGDGRVS